ncbi:MAG: hypothetical protein KAX19_05805 [Candidatus Brocadiae bacterium]|nr:hypothetical protein [Candidatus Brocadiia bacterium]
MPRKRRKAESFEQKRKKLLVTASETSGQPTEKVIRFQNNDVPDFLRAFDQFEKRSRTARILVT